MKSKNSAYICIMCLFVAAILSNCTAKHRYDFSLKDTLSISVE